MPVSVAWIRAAEQWGAKKCGDLPLQVLDDGPDDGGGFI